MTNSAKIANTLPELINKLYQVSMPPPQDLTIGKIQNTYSGLVDIILSGSLLIKELYTTISCFNSGMLLIGNERIKVNSTIPE
jgi:hypothetical protein